MSDWQPIETAPKAGFEESVLLWSDLWDMTWGVQIGHYDDGVWYCADGEVEETDEAAPTHWMPLPDPPEPQP